MICLIFPSVSQLELTGNCKRVRNLKVLLNMKTKKVGKVTIILKDRIGHPLKRHLTEVSTRINTLRSTRRISGRSFQIHISPKRLMI